MPKRKLNSDCSDFFSGFVMKFVCLLSRTFNNICDGSVSQSGAIKLLRACSYPLLRLLLNVFETPCTVSGCLVKRSLVCDLPANNISKMEAKALPYFNCNFGTIIRFKYPICSRQVDFLRMNMHANLRNLTKST